MVLLVLNRVGCKQVLPPVSLSSTRISNFSSLQGISGSSPITVRVASNSPSTRNFTRPLAMLKKTFTTKQWNKHLRAERLSTITGGYENNYMHYSGFKRLAYQLWGLPTGGAGLWWRGDVAGSDSAGSGSSAFQTWWWDLEEWSCPAEIDAEMFVLTNAKEKTFDSATLSDGSLTRIHVGKRGYDPVVRTSMAKGMAKLGRRACTRASLAKDASLSAVSTNRMVCWSKKLEIICRHGDEGKREKHIDEDTGVWWLLVQSMPDRRILRKEISTQLTAHFSTFPALLAHFTKASRRTNSCLVRLANCTISIFLQKTWSNDKSVRMRLSLRLINKGTGNFRANFKDTYLSMSVFLGSLEYTNDTLS